MPVPAVDQTPMRMSRARPITVVEPALQKMMVAKRLLALRGVTENPARLRSQRSHCGVWRDPPTVRGLASHTPHRPPGDGRHDFQQMPLLRIAVKRARYLPHALSEVRRSPGYRMSDFRKHLLRRRRYRPGYYRKQLAGSHSNKRQEVLSGLVFGFCFGREFSQVLHHGIGIDLAYRADLVLVFVFELILLLAFAEQAADRIADGAEPAFAFQSGFVFHLFFQFALVLELVFEFVFQFIFQLVRHDESSSRKVLGQCKVLVASPELCVCAGYVPGRGGEGAGTGG